MLKFFSFPARKYRKLLSQIGIFMKSISNPLLFTAILPSSFNYISLELALQKLHSSTSHLGSLRALSLQCFNRVAQICQKLKFLKNTSLRFQIWSHVFQYAQKIENQCTLKGICTYVGLYKSALQHTSAQRTNFRCAMEQLTKK